MPSTRRITRHCYDALFESIPPKEVEQALRPFLTIEQAAPATTGEKESASVHGDRDLQAPGA